MSSGCWRRLLLEILVVRHQPHRAADQARRGLAAGGQQGLQDDDGRTRH